MPHFSSDGVDIRYIDEGSGEPVLLIHGFASNIEVNWAGTSWVSSLTHAGRRAIAFDHRGHGRSEKLYDPALYGADVMAEDARRLLDHLGIAQADVVGYSMGARVGAFLAIRHPRRVRTLTLGGMAGGLLKGVGHAEEIAAGLEAPSAEAIADPTARTFRVFAEATKSDLRALAACMRSQRSRIEPDDLARIAAPVLVAVGTEDRVAGRPEDLLAVLRDAELLLIEGRDHNRAVGAREHKEGVLAFLARHAAGGA